MPVVDATLARIATFGDNSHVVTWTPLLNGDSGSPVEMPGAADRTVQVTGTFGAGGNVIIEGSLDGVTYATLNDPTGSALGTITTAGLTGVLEVVRYIRPRVSAGDGDTELTVLMIARRP